MPQTSLLALDPDSPPGIRSLGLVGRYTCVHTDTIMIIVVILHRSGPFKISRVCSLIITIFFFLMIFKKFLSQFYLFIFLLHNISLVFAIQ